MTPKKPPYEVETKRDVNGRYHIWLVPKDHKNLPTMADLYAEAQKIVIDFKRREFSESQETLTAGAFHLIEKGFIGYATVE